MAAAKKLYPDAVLVFSGSQEKKLRDFIAAFNPVEVCQLKNIDLSKITRLIIADTKTPERIGPFSGVLRPDGGPEVHIYDHHPRTENDIRGLVEVIESVGATATIFTEILRSKKIPVTPMDATMLCLGIYEETGSLLFPSTTERDILAAAYLLKKGASLKIVANYIKLDLNKEDFGLLNELLQSSTDMESNGIKIKIVKASREDYSGDIARLAHSIMEIEDIDGLILLMNAQGKIMMVGRSRAPELDISEVMRKFGGGGHAGAASASVKEASLEMIEEDVKRLLAGLARYAKSAGDVMTTPVISVSQDGMVKDAESMMTRYGVNVLPVVEGEKYKGIISREVVEKAIFHGFGKSRVADFATTDALTVAAGTPIRDIEKLMIEHNQRFMPVVENGKTIGAITRTDILRTIYEDILKKNRLETASPDERHSAGRSLAAWLRERFPQPVPDMLKLAGEAADGLGFNAYLVGGSVRDLLRGEENLDIDIVIEGSGTIFAREFASMLNARVKTHERFGTAQVMTGGIKIDVATSRTEYYESPASLPKVETSSIKKDLYRRDFTINTLAVKLNPRDFGLLIDFFGAQRDIREKSIRVLHNLSFIEDPTRAFRAVRFAERFGFKISKHTEGLIKSALRMNLFDRLSGSRLYEELLLTFNETEPVRAIKKLSEYGLLKVIHPNLKFDEKLELRFQAVHDTLSWFNLLFLEQRPDRGTLYLMTLLSCLNDVEREDAMDRFRVSQKARDEINKGIAGARDIMRLLPLNDPKRIYKSMRGLDIKTMLFAMALAPEDRKKKEISLYLIELRKIRPALKGDDLNKMGIPPGPAYSEILEAVLEKRLEGKLNTKEDEMAFVRERYVK